VREILGGRRNVGLVLWGVAGFLPSADLATIAQTLYEWAGPQTCLAFQAQAVTLNPNDPSMQRAQEIYERMGAPFFVRSLAETERLLEPWRADEPGFIDLLRWHSLSGEALTQADIDSFGEAGGSYGAYLIK
jgi:hypothetical protein